MNTNLKMKIQSMLMEAYYRLGEKSVTGLDARVRKAMDYLSRDRERYIEAVGLDTPEYLITVLAGVICRLIPLAQEIIEEQEKDHVRRHRGILYIMVSGEDVRYVYACSQERISPDPLQNVYTYPIYRYIELEEIPDKLQIGDPQEISPASTQKDWNIYCRIFEAFAHFWRESHINVIPHKTERAMLAAAHAVFEELTVDENKIVGKIIPLATSDSVWEQNCDDHRYSWNKKLCLLIAGDEIRYLMQTQHHYHYFRKEIVDDAPGACIYKSAGEKHETTYEFINLADLRQDMYPLYY